MSDTLPSHLPVTDPTALTTAALHRETGVLRESIKQRFEALRSIDDRFFALLDGATESLRPALSVSKSPKTASALINVFVASHGCIASGVSL